MAILRIVGFVAALAVWAGCAGPDVRGPFRTQFVDAETGKPIEGVVFLAVWYSITPNFVSGPSEQFYEAREDVSGADGRVEIARLTGPLWKAGYGVRFYSFGPSGYATERVHVDAPQERRYVDPTVVHMRPLQTLEERCRRIRLALPSPSIPNHATKIPRYLDAVTREGVTCGVNRSQ